MDQCQCCYTDQSTKPEWAAIEELGEQAIGHIIPGLPYQDKEVILFLMGSRKLMKVFKKERKII